MITEKAIIVEQEARKSLEIRPRVFSAFYCHKIRSHEFLYIPTFADCVSFIQEKRFFFLFDCPSLKRLERFSK